MPEGGGDGERAAETERDRPGGWDDEGGTSGPRPGKYCASSTLRLQFCHDFVHLFIRLIRDDVFPLKSIFFEAFNDINITSLRRSEHPRKFAKFSSEEE